MSSDRCYTLPGDINANISPKDFAGTSDESADVCCCFKAVSELLELPFFEEDISKVFEIETKIKNKKRRKMIFWKRKWYFKKYRLRHVKQREHSQTPTTTQENGQVELMISGKEHKKDHEVRRSEDHCFPSGELKVCDMESNETVKITQQFHGSTLELHDDLQSSREMKPESRVAGNIKPSIDKDIPVQGQSLHTTHIEDEYDETDSKIKKDEQCQPSEDVERFETLCEVIQDPSPETEIKGSKESISDVQINTQQNSKERRLRPNYFVAIPVTNDEILDFIEDVQEHIVLKEPKLLRALIPAERVHITILVAHLQTEEDIKRAISALLQTKGKVEQLLHGKPFGLPLHGIGEFNNQVIYIKITEQEQELLSKIAEVVTQCFIDVGVNIAGSKAFKPHLTFLKLSKVPSLRRKGFRRICSELYKEYEDFSFGIETFSRIDLCSMHKKNKESGYYYCESSVFIDGVMPSEAKESIPEIKQDSDDPVPEGDVCAESSIRSSPAVDADKISSDIADALTISKKEEIKETDGYLEATNANLGEKSGFQSTPDLFPAAPIASTAVDDGLEKQN